MTTTKDLWGQISDLEAMVREWKARAEKAEAQVEAFKQEHQYPTMLRKMWDLIEAQRVSEADIVVGSEENAALLARAEKAEAQRDDWKAMHRHAQQTIADLNGDLKGQRARAEKAEAEVARLADERASPAPTRKVLWTWML